MAPTSSVKVHISHKYVHDLTCLFNGPKWSIHLERTSQDNYGCTLSKIPVIWTGSDTASFKYKLSKRHCVEWDCLCTIVNNQDLDIACWFTDGQTCIPCCIVSTHAPPPYDGYISRDLIRSEDNILDKIKSLFSKDEKAPLEAKVQSHRNFRSRSEPSLFHVGSVECSRQLSPRTNDFPTPPRPRFEPIGVHHRRSPMFGPRPMPITVYQQVAALGYRPSFFFPSTTGPRTPVPQLHHYRSPRHRVRSQSVRIVGQEVGINSAELYGSLGGRVNSRYSHDGFVNYRLDGDQFSQVVIRRRGSFCHINIS
ncbi:hypothetical protein BS50DRAFT_662795 [Corynespora cassiicola Philippines]|uniref:Uncharacterized protein n=1 Tax=Corynespora cassiicola Philippines TaxID=1448308 RepID=A0A2T2NYV0_CORCC|nr:hypothetical protein BS50DRAFT_662795 [Corynespora cassiicola Philippines]